MKTEVNESNLIHIFHITLLTLTSLIVVIFVLGEPFVLAGKSLLIVYRYYRFISSREDDDDSYSIEIMMSDEHKSDLLA